MTENTLNQIKQTEQQSQKIVNDAKQKVEDTIAKITQDGEDSVKNAENLVAPQIEEIISVAKKGVQISKAREERTLANNLQSITDIDSKAIEKAAEKIVKEITN